MKRKKQGARRIVNPSLQGFQQGKANIKQNGLEDTQVREECPNEHSKRKAAPAPGADAADTAAAASPYLAALQERTALTLTELWHLTLLVMQGGGALFMFLGAALWRLHVRRHALPYGRQARRAVHTCRAAGAGILLVQGVLA